MTRAVPIPLLLPLLALPAVALAAPPQTVARYAGPGEGAAYARHLVGDFDGDGRNDVAALDAQTAFADGAFDEASEGTVQLRAVSPAGGRSAVFAVIHPPGSAPFRMTLLRRGGRDGLVVVSADGQLAIFDPSVSGVAGVRALGRAVKDLAVGDLDADGEPDVVVTHEFAGTSAQRVSDGAPLWTTPLRAGTKGTDTDYAAVVVGAFDADPALEVVVAGPVGRVFDGATGALEWEYAGGIEQKLAAGRIGPGASPGFVGGEYGVTGFRSAPYSPLWTLKFPVAQVVTADVDGNGSDELLLADRYDVAGMIVDPQAQAQVPGTTIDGRALAVGTFDAAGPTVVSYGRMPVDRARARGVQRPADHIVPRGLQLRTLDGTSRLALEHERSGYWRTAVGDLDADGRVEGVYLAGVGPADENLNLDAHLHVVALGGGGERWTRYIDDRYFWGASSVAVAQLDADAALEIVVGGHSLFNPSLHVIDGATRALEQYATDLGEFDERFIGMHVVGSGAAQRVVIASGFDRVRVRRYRVSPIASDTVVELPEALGRYVADSELAELDGDASPEILIATDAALVAVDVETGSVQWSRPGAVNAVAVTTDGAQTRVLAAARSGTLQRVLPNGSDDGAPVALGTEVLAIALLGTSGLTAVCADRRVAIVDQALAVVERSDFVGMQACRAGDIASAETAPAQYSLLVGSVSTATELSFGASTVFADGFENRF